jgi:hypothetical protein
LLPPDFPCDENNHGDYYSTDYSPDDDFCGTWHKPPFWGKLWTNGGAAFRPAPPPC